MLTMPQIMSKTPQSRRELSDLVKVLATKTGKNVDGMPILTAKVATIYNPKNYKTLPKDDRIEYVATVEVYPKKKVMVSCSCYDFLYTFEYALTQKGSARIEYSNGEHPSSRNPSLQCGMCKHLYALAIKLISKGYL